MHGFGGWIFTYSAVENAVYCTIDFRATGICLLSRIGKKRWFSKQKICLAMNKLYVPIFIMLLLLLLPKSDLCRLFGTIGHWRRGGRIFLPKRRKKKIGCKTCDGLLLLSVYIYTEEMGNCFGSPSPRTSPTTSTKSTPKQPEKKKSPSPVAVQQSSSSPASREVLLQAAEKRMKQQQTRGIPSGTR